ncbi:hypothetical protein C1O24_20835 [Vibrio diazotrophicus]|nr:hypothetical protein C1O24_20835 [Vibrio diazotrophicus]
MKFFACYGWLHRNFSWSVMFRGLGFSFIAVPFTLRSYSHNVFQIMHLGANKRLQRNQLTRRLSRTANAWRFWFNWLVCLRWLL